MSRIACDNGGSSHRFDYVDVRIRDGYALHTCLVCETVLHWGAPRTHQAGELFDYGYDADSDDGRYRARVGAELHDPATAD